MGEIQGIMKQYINLIKKIAISLCFMLLFSIGSIVSISAGSDIMQCENIDYEMGENGWIVKKYNGSEKVVNLPAEIDGIPVVEISPVAFSNNLNIEEVNIPYTIKKIGGTDAVGFGEESNFAQEGNLDNIIYDSTNPGAFAYCINLKRVYIDNNSQLKYIGAMAFNNCINLKKINLPEQMDEIGISAFYRCESLISFTVPNGIEVIEQRVFGSCYSLKEVIFPETLKNIEYGAFDGCQKLTELSLPENVEKIDRWAFASVSLKEINLGKKLSYIDYSTFSNCPYLECINVDKDNSYYLTENGVLKKLLIN